jgi:hypothetical protein
MYRMFKNLLRTSGVGFCMALLMAFGIVESKQLGQVQAEQRVKYGVNKKSLAQIQEQTTPDAFTQTTAHLQTKFVKDRMAKASSSDYVPYLNVIFDCLVKEQDLKNSHYAFYHTTANEWRLAQDVFGQAYARAHPSEKIEDFFFLRFTDFKENSPRNLLLEELKKYGIVDNDQDHLKLVLLSVNLSLFGNIDWKSSSSWDYFINQKLDGPSRKIYEIIMDQFGLTHKYIDELMSLVELIKTKENALLQIFIPQNKVDQIGYLAWSLGFPSHQKTIDWVSKHIKKTSGKIGSGTDRAKALKELSGKFKKNEQNALFKDLLKSVEEGDFSLNAFLKIYRNKPWDIEDIDHAQARLIFTPNGLLNPAADIRFYRYSTTTPEQLREYTQRLNVIMNKIFAESKKGGK